MLRDGGTYVEMGPFTDAGTIATNWHRICTKDINVLGSWDFTANDTKVSPCWIAPVNAILGRAANLISVYRGGYKRGARGCYYHAQCKINDYSLCRYRVKGSII